MYSVVEEQEFQFQNYAKQSLSGQSFINCIFRHCDFSATGLRNAKFCTCTFHECNWSLAKIDGCRFQDVQFVDCKLVGLEFFKCDSTFFSPAFKKCLLHYCNFSDLSMKLAVFAESKLKECYFTNTHLAGADFSHADLLGTQFHACDLSQANFSTAANYDIDPRANKLKKAKFSLPEAVNLLRGFEITLV